jgi:histidinol-phosphate/aromatic aminotransferase/cobyric acid decarboxylase-like protein
MKAKATSGPVQVPPAGGHGGDALEVAAALGLDTDQVIDLSASMNPFAPDVSAMVAAEVTARPRTLGWYPDASRATAQLADAIGVDRSVLVLTNGGAEAIALVAAECPRGRVVEPEFSLYRRHLRDVTEDAPRWRSNPSNPLGRLAGGHESAAVWDEAFYPLATGHWTRNDANCWRLGSLTKLWSCPGLRLGYVIAPSSEQADRIRTAQPRWSVNGMALALVEPLLAATDLAGWQTAIAKRRSLFDAALTELGFRTTTTDVNWVLVERPGLRSALAVHGVVVRDCESFGLPGLHRVALPHDRELDRVLTAFGKVDPR